MGNLLKGRVAIITGSGQGIGKDLAVWMAAQGCKVITNNRKKGSSMQAHEGKTVLLNDDDKKKLSAIIGDAESAAEAVNTNPDVIAAGAKPSRSTPTSPSWRTARSWWTPLLRSGAAWTSWSTTPPLPGRATSRR